MRTVSRRPMVYRPVTLHLGVRARASSTRRPTGSASSRSTDPRRATRSTARWRSASRRRWTAWRTTPTIWVGVLAPNTADAGEPGLLRRRRPQGRPGDGLGRGARHRAGRLRRLRVPRAHEADRRRGRRARDRGRLEIVLAADVVVATHAVGVRAGGGAAQPDRGGRRAVPPPARDRARGGDGRDPHRRADRRPARVRPRAREPAGRAGRRAGRGAARRAARSSPAAPLAVRASRRVVLAAASEDDDTLRRVSRELLDELLASEDAAEGLAAFAEKRPPRWRGR